MFKCIYWYILIGLNLAEEIASPVIDHDENKSGPTIRVQIPTGLRKAGRQYNKLEMAKRIAAARQANKEVDRAEHRQLSWESLVLPSHQEPVPPEDDSVSYENQQQMEDSLPDIKRYIHVDLAAAPPTVDYLENLFTLFSQNQIDGVFLEYGNRFPFDGIISKLSTNKPYSKRNIQTIVQFATKLNIEILPGKGLYSYFLGRAAKRPYIKATSRPYRY